MHLRLVGVVSWSDAASLRGNCDRGQRDRPLDFWSFSCAGVGFGLNHRRFVLTQQVRAFRLDA